MQCAGFSGLELISESQIHSGNVCCAQMSQHSTFFWEKMDIEFSVPKTKGTIQISLATEAKANVCHGMRVQQSKQHGLLAYV